MRGENAKLREISGCVERKNPLFLVESLAVILKTAKSLGGWSVTVGMAYK
jgi:hypothetical protein